MKKRLEIKEVGIKSAFKATLYVACIPLGIMALIGILVTIIGAVLGEGSMLMFGIPYIIMPFFMLGIYGLISMLVALVYNAFSKKFGGLELVVNDQSGDAKLDGSHQTD